MPDFWPLMIWLLQANISFSGVATSNFLDVILIGTISPFITDCAFIYRSDCFNNSIRDSWFPFLTPRNDSPASSSLLRSCSRLLAVARILLRSSASSGSSSSSSLTRATSCSSTSKFMKVLWRMSLPFKK